MKAGSASTLPRLAAALRRGALGALPPAAARLAARAADSFGCRAERTAGRRRQIRLRLARAERRLDEAAAHRRPRRPRSLSLRCGNCWSLPSASARRLEVRILLAELFLRGRDQAEIMLGVLEVIFGRDRIAGRMGVAGKLEIFLGDVIGRAADLHVGAVGFVHPRQRVMVAAIVIVVVVLLLLRPRMRLLWCC